MNEIEPASPGTEIVIPLTGEIVTLDNPENVANALSTLQILQQQIRDVQVQLERCLVDHSVELGKKTILLPNGRKVMIQGGSETVYDAQAIMEGLREAGMPEHRISEIVTETVEYKVKAVEAKRAASVNPAYKEVIERNAETKEKRPYVKLK